MWFFVNIYRIQKQITSPSSNFKYYLPVSSNKVKISCRVREVLIFLSNSMTKLSLCC